MNVAVILLFAVCVVVLETGSRVEGKMISLLLLFIYFRGTIICFHS